MHSCFFPTQWWIYIVNLWTSPTVQILSKSYSFLGEIRQNHMLAPPGGLAYGVLSAHISWKLVTGDLLNFLFSISSPKLLRVPKIHHCLFSFHFHTSVLCGRLSYCEDNKRVVDLISMASALRLRNVLGSQWEVQRLSTLQGYDDSFRYYVLWRMGDRTFVEISLVMYNFTEGYTDLLFTSRWARLNGLNNYVIFTSVHTYSRMW